MSYVQVILDYMHPAHATAQHIVLPKKHLPEQVCFRVNFTVYFKQSEG